MPLILFFVYGFFSDNIMHSGAEMRVYRQESQACEALGETHGIHHIWRLSFDKSGQALVTEGEYPCRPTGMMFYAKPAPPEKP